MKQQKGMWADQPWLFSARVDSLLITTPALWIVAGVLLFHNQISQLQEMPLWVWVVFILCIDVAHVYATLFRTYFDREEFNRNRSFYTLVPLVVWVAGALLYSVDDLLFWRVLAYVAVFHFIRQQYGFMMLYSRKEEEHPNFSRTLDRVFIYTCTLYPIIFWHAHLPREYIWFVEEDFVPGLPLVLERITFAIYLLVAIAYLAKEGINSYKLKKVNIPKNVFALGTAVSWYVGIVAFNGDIIFSVVNVVSHGIPYMALVWIYGRKQMDRLEKQGNQESVILNGLFRPQMCAFYVLFLIALAWIEEGFWNGLVWRDHLAVFPLFSQFNGTQDTAMLAWVVSLLSLPQVTHYVLDGFIWRMREEQSEWKNIMFRFQS